MLDFRTHTFLKVCQTLNFTLAAKELHISQPAVSQHIHFLEEAYDTKLFIYQNKQLSLTSSGKILYKHLLTLKNDEEKIKEELKSSQTKIQSLSIGVTMTIGEYAVVDQLAAFIKKHPNINIHLHYGNTSQLLKLLNQGTIQMAIVEGNYPKEDYCHKKYRTEDFIALCANSHQFNKEQPSYLHDLCCEHLLLREEGSGTRNILEQNLKAHNLSIAHFQHYTQIENMHALIRLLKKDCGISFMYKIAVEKDLKKGTLKEIHLKDFKMQHDFDFIWEKNSIYSEVYLKICNELIQEDVNYSEIELPRIRR